MYVLCIVRVIITKKRTFFLNFGMHSYYIEVHIQNHFEASKKCMISCYKTI
jgi:hypothetical protein